MITFLDSLHVLLTDLATWLGVNDAITLMLWVCVAVWLWGCASYLRQGLR
jgi:hypothetical protein